MYTFIISNHVLQENSHTIRNTDKLNLKKAYRYTLILKIHFF